MAGYSDTREKIINTLLGRPEGTEIQPDKHQDYALSLLDYIRSVELIGSSTLIGTAAPETVPVQPDDANVAYISTVNSGEEKVFTNFRRENGSSVVVTSSIGEARVVILTWNKAYWESTEAVILGGNSSSHVWDSERPTEMEVGGLSVGTNLKGLSVNQILELMVYGEVIEDLQLIPSAINTFEDGGTYTIQVSSTRPWAATTEFSWIELSNVTNDSVDVTINSNETGVDRSGSVRFTAGEMVQNLVVQQTFYEEDAITINPQSATSGYGSNLIKINLTSNVTWKATKLSDIFDSINPMEGGSGNAEVTVSFTENTSPETRSGQIRFESVDETISTTFTLQQSGQVILIPKPDSVEVSKESGSVTIAVTSNVEWTATSEVSWVTPTKEGDNLILTYTQNENAYLRNGRVTLSGGGKESYVDITQAEETIEELIVSPLSHEFIQAGGEVTLNVTSNDRWIINKDNFPANWRIEGDITEWVGDKAIKIIADANINSTVIDYNLNIATETKSVNVELSQLEYIAPYITPSKTEITLPAIKGNDETISINANVDWNYTEDSDWFSVTRSGNNLIISYTTNDLAYPKAGSIVITSLELEDVYINVTQEANIASELVVLPSSWNDITYAGGNRTFTVESNGTWYVDRNNEMPYWIQSNVNVGNLDGEFTLTVSENTSETPRTSFVTVAMEKKSVNVAISQNGYTPPKLIPDETEVTLPETSGVKNINIDSNIDWSYTTDLTWVTLSKVDSTLVVNYEENPNSYIRLGGIILSGEGVDAVTISIRQDADTSILLNVKPNSYEFSYKGESKTFEVESNGTWFVDYHNEAPSWISIDKAQSSGNGTFVVTVDQNVVSEKRSFNLGVTTGSKTVTIPLSQRGYTPSTNPFSNGFSAGFGDATPVKTLDIDKTTHTADNGDSVMKFNVTSNTTWTSEAPAGWITRTPTDGNGDSEVTVNIDANIIESERVGTITIIATDTTLGLPNKVLTITQEPKDAPSLEVAPKTFSVSNTANVEIFDITSNVEWQISKTATWFYTKDVYSPVISGEGDKRLYIEILENTTSSERSDIITIKAKDETLGIPNVVLSVTQSAGLAPTPFLNFITEGTTTPIASTSWTDIPLRVEHNIDYEAYNISPWLNVTNSDNEDYVIYDVTENTGLDTRTGTFGIRGIGENSGLTDIFTVQQLGKGLILTPTSAGVDFNNQTVEINVQSSSAFTVESNVEWITTSISGNVVSCDLQRNYGAERNGIVTITNSAKSIEFPITQGLGEAASLELDFTTTKIVNGVEGTFENNITSNVEWEIIDDSLWLTSSKSSGNGDSVITYLYPNNNDMEERESIVTVRSTNVNPQLSKTFKVTQSMPSGLTLDPEVINTPNNTGESMIEITSSFGWSYSIIEGNMLVAEILPIYGVGLSVRWDFYGGSGTIKIEVSSGGETKILTINKI